MRSTLNGGWAPCEVNTGLMIQNSSYVEQSETVLQLWRMFRLSMGHHRLFVFETDLQSLRSLSVERHVFVLEEQSDHHALLSNTRHWMTTRGTTVAIEISHYTVHDANRSQCRLQLRHPHTELHDLDFLSRPRSSIQLSTTLWRQHDLHDLLCTFHTPTTMVWH